MATKKELVGWLNKSFHDDDLVVCMNEDGMWDNISDISKRDGMCAISFGESSGVRAFDFDVAHRYQQQIANHLRAQMQGLERNLQLILGARLPGWDLLSTDELQRRIYKIEYHGSSSISVFLDNEEICQIVKPNASNQWNYQIYHVMHDRIRRLGG